MPSWYPFTTFIEVEIFIYFEEQHDADFKK